MAGAAALAVVLLVVIGALTFPSSQDDPGAPMQGTAGPTQVPESETLFVPGYEEAPGGFVLSDPADAQGVSTSVELTYDKTAPRITSQAGLSFDARELANPMWGSTESNLALTLEELDSPALRFGGNGIDRHVWWTSSDEPVPEWASTTVTPEDLERVADVADKVDASVTIALDLGHDDPARAADMAAHARDAFGDRLLAVAIGTGKRCARSPAMPPTSTGTRTRRARSESGCTRTS